MATNRSWAAALGLVASSCAIAGISLLVSSPKPAVGESAQAPAPTTVLPKPASTPEEVPVQLPPPDQRGIEESAVPVDNLNAIDLVSNTLLAIEREDTAWLARTLESLAGKPMLSEVDALTAHRQFTWRSIAPRWNKIRQAWRDRSYDVIDNGDTAEIHVHVGGNLGTDVLKLVRINGNWYFADV